MEHYSHPLDMPVSEMHMKMVGQVSSNPESHHLYTPMPISSNPVFNTSMVPNSGVGYNESSAGSMGSSPIYVSDQLGSKDASMMNNMADEKTPLPVKRKAEAGPLTSNSISPRLQLPNKRPAHMGADVSSVGFLQSSAPQRKTAPAQSKFGSAGVPAQHSQNKKMVRNDSMSGKSSLQRGPSAKRQTAHIESASKARPDSAEAVRSKMRESLASALALAFRKQDDVSNTEKNQSEGTITQQPVDSSASDISKESAALSKTNECQLFSAEIPPNGSSGNGGQAFQGFQYSSILPDEDISFGDNFFAKDDLLQGNGLSWAFDFDAQQMGNGKETQHEENPKPMKEEAQGRGKEIPHLTPENLAFEIEAELFKLFGDVNKKYREKGRSLMFNLKDRNNPDLRERVMSGEISPERLCSMSAEELASKELSQWRMAKAEELAQMVVLPDTEVDKRRFVKKTHKGEYQVEVDHDDAIAAEISSGTSMLTRPQQKKETEPHSPSKASVKDKERGAGQGSSMEDQDFSGSLVIPTDGTDLMQGMIVDDLKDAEFLPPIVSLDEFMESLNNEPPFENLPGDAGKKTPTPRGESPKLSRNPLASNRASSDSPKDASSRNACIFKKHDATVKSSGSPAKQIHSIVPKVDYIWNGTLQLNISASVTVGGLFQSGEKTSMNEWPTSLEIKGRVRLDAFEKFLQELPNSRTRAVMVLRFVLKDTTSENQRANLSEAVDSYVTDERLGYAEPAPGVELYLCPPVPRIYDTLNKLATPKENPDANDTVENGLIGVVVWRRAHVNNVISPNSSHHKHVSKKQQPFGPLKRAQDSCNVNVNVNGTPSRTPPPVLNNLAGPEKEEDDDIPPGFGPAAAARTAAKDDDDLPEFNFSGDLKINPSIVHRASPQNLPKMMTQRPVDQVRELIKKYGQSGNSVTSGSGSGRVDNMNIGIEPWNDDDDDIPEWRPQAMPPYGAVAAHGHRPPPMVTQQLPGGVGHPGPGGRWVQPPGPLRGPRWRPY